jgi:A/G-specific adenine glycosylase
MTDFAGAIIDWQRAHGRHQLPWQGSRDPYRIWLSEVMLQQTQVATVIPYYQRFIAAFPDVAGLAAAPLEEVMRLWSGLGYYSRARNLHRCAVTVMERHGGRFPSDAAGLASLPGIGRSTAAAIAVFATGERAAILDGNVRRVLCRAFGVEGWPGERLVEARLWQLAEELLPGVPVSGRSTLGAETGIGAYTQGLMDLGATVCTRARPACNACPLRTRCVALREGSVARLPTPRPKRVSPLRRCRMFALRASAGWLVEKRPPAGIWGGLWSLPQGELVEAADAGAGAGGAPVGPAPNRQGARDSVQAEAERIAARHGLRISAAIERPGFMHAFTHFRLLIEPVICEVVAVRELNSGVGAGWLRADEVEGAALPQPVKRLLLDEAMHAVAAGDGLRAPDAAADTGVRAKAA